jgi:hypothetical protein
MTFPTWYVEIAVSVDPATVAASLPTMKSCPILCARVIVAKTAFARSAAVRVLGAAAAAGGPDAGVGPGVAVVPSLVPESADAPDVVADVMPVPGAGVPAGAPTDGVLRPARLCGQLLPGTHAAPSRALGAATSTAARAAATVAAARAAAPRRGIFIGS